jgi:hypothetical protein
MPGGVTGKAREGLPMSIIQSALCEMRVAGVGLVRVGKNGRKLLVQQRL